MLVLVVIFALINGALSLVGGLGLLFWSKEKIARINAWLVPVTAGVLLATALFEILPETLPYFYTKSFVWVFVGIAAFFFLGQFMHRLEHTNADRRAIGAIVVTSVIHNLLYGAILAVFTTSVGTGLMTAVILALSDIPHELGVSSLLLHHGLSRKQVLKLQLWVTLPTLLGAVAGYLLRSDLYVVMPYILSLLAGWFIYIVVHDTFGEMESLKAHPVKQLLGFVLGTLFVLWLIYRFGNVPFGYHPLYTDMPL